MLFKNSVLLYKTGLPELQDLVTSHFQICMLDAVVRFREANFHTLPVYGSVTWIDFACDTPTFAYLRIRGSVVRLQLSVIY
jgi:hypothetical protein